MNSPQTFYKMGSNGLLVWSINTEHNKVIIDHGRMYGSKQQEVLELSSPIEATTELNRRIHIKTTQQGYSTFIPESIPRLPMLALDYDPERLSTTFYVQPKLDGIRCIATNNTMYSRKWKPITSMLHIREELKQLSPDITLDGELYCHGLSFQEHMSRIRRQEYTTLCSSIHYHVYDIQMNAPYEDRLEALNEVFAKYTFNSITQVSTILSSKMLLDTLLPKYKEYEGVILRSPNTLYEYNVRSPGLQKYKWNATIEVQIVDIIAAKSGREKDAAIFVCKTEDGVKFKARPAMNVEIRRAYYRNRDNYIGHFTRVTYEGLSKDKVPLKPRAEGIERTAEDFQ